MYKQTITFTDFDGNERTEDHYFHLTKAEFFNWLTMAGDYTIDKLLLKLVSEHNGKETMRIFEELIKKSYGVKSLDGRKFQKSEEIWENFYSTNAYSQMFMEIVLDAEKAVQFFNGIIPPEMLRDLENELLNVPDAVKKDLPPEVLEAMDKIARGSKPENRAPSLAAKPAPPLLPNA